MPEADKHPQDIIREALEGKWDNVDGLLTILYNVNLDFTNVEEFWEGHLNHAWIDRINEKIKEGFIVFRIQTEFQLNGHETHIYMAKMKG
jgi:hypothetical protein